MLRPFSLLCAGLTLFVSVFGGGGQAWAQREVIQHQPYVDLRKYYLGFRLGMHAPDLRITNRGYMTPEGTSLWADTPSYQPGFSVGVIGGVVLVPSLELRLMPTLHLGETEVDYTDGRSRVASHSVKMHSVTLPLELKWGAMRLGNIRPFISAGIYAGSFLGGRRGDVLRLKALDYGAMLGFGCDLYFRLFKLSPQLTLSYGLSNALDTKRTDLRDDHRIYYTHAIERAASRMVLLSFSFE